MAALNISRPDCDGQMKLYYIGQGDACTVYVLVGGLTATTTLYKAGQEYPDGIAEILLRDYSTLASKEVPKLIKLAVPTVKKGGEK